jgi:PleD family two-component response regulator
MTRAKTQHPKTRGGTNRDTPKTRASTSADAPKKRRAESSIGSTDPFDRVRATSVIEEQLVEITELPEITPLQVAVYEGAANLPGAKAAVTRAGHVAAVGVSGADGLEKLKKLVTTDTIDVVIVAIPGGEVIIDAALAVAPRRPVIIAVCVAPVLDAVAHAHATGADLVTVRPHDVDKLAPLLMAAARLVDERRHTNNARGSEAVLRSRLDELTEPDARGLQPFELFQRVLELELKRAKRYAYPLAVALFTVDIAPPEPPTGVRGILRARAGNALIHTVRDIDMATELEHERFLVLLPYTDLAGAAEVARRVIAAVADADPVTAAGRTFPSRVIAGVAGARPGEPLSFARLMRDATQALDHARREGVELSVSELPSEDASPS